MLTAPGKASVACSLPNPVRYNFDAMLLDGRCGGRVLEAGWGQQGDLGQALGDDPVLSCSTSDSPSLVHPNLLLHPKTIKEKEGWPPPVSLFLQRGWVWVSRVSQYLRPQTAQTEKNLGPPQLGPGQDDRRDPSGRCSRGERSAGACHGHDGSRSLSFHLVHRRGGRIGERLRRHQARFPG